jgi:pilus assembly protein CpaE
MTEHPIRAALISTDPRFRQVVHEIVLDSDARIALGLELTVPYTQFGESEVGAFRTLNPELVFLDLGDAPDLGVKFAQFVTESGSPRHFIAAGPVLSPELLLEAMRAGVSDYLTKPVLPDSLRGSVQRVGAKLGRSGGGGERPRQPGVVYTFASAKGGAGSTTVVTNLAISLQQLTGKRTLLVDLELQLGEVALLMGVKPRFTFVDLVQNFHRMDAGLLASFIVQHASGVHLLSAPYHPDRVESVGIDQTRRILRFLRQHYDYVLVDTSKSLSPETLGVFEQSDLVFMVTTPDLQSIRNIQRGLPLLRRAVVGGEKQIRIVINRSDGSEAVSRADIERTLGIKAYWSLGNDYEGVMNAVNTGKPVVLDGKSRFSRDLRGLSVELAGLRTGAAGRGSNPFRRLWSRVKRSSDQVVTADE